MATSTKLKLRNLWLQVHKWIGLLLAVLIIPISVTGAALVWHDGLDSLLNRQRSVAAAPTLSPAAYAAAASSSLAADERVVSVRMPEEEGAVVVTAQKSAVGEGRPVRTSLYLHPQTGALLDKAGGNEGLVRAFHQIHGSIMVPGVGRQIVGWVGVFMLLSCLTGIWLWWPLTGSVRRGFRWKRQPSFNANLHHQLGFWIMIPLAMLSFTGVWISFPQTFGRFEASALKSPSGPPRPAAPLAQPRLGPDEALAAARQAAGNAPLRAISWPTDQKPAWTITLAGEEGPSDVAVTDADGAAKPAPAPPPETMARLMRRLHDGTGLGFVWQFIIFLGGLIPAILSVTGILMWWRARQWRRRASGKARAPAAAQ